MPRKIAAALLGIAILTLWSCAGSTTSDADREAAVRGMASDPEKAKALLRGATDPVGRLDYALYLHAFGSRSTEQIATIRALLNPLADEAYANLDSLGREIIGDKEQYDGSDESLIKTLRAISSVGLANTQSAFYAIPCGVLQRRPDLLDAIDPIWGSNRDNFLPRAGCDWGRGVVVGFPYEPIRAYTAAVQKLADSLEPDQGSIRFMVAANAAANLTRLEIDPLSFSTDPDPERAYPFETKCYPQPQPMLRARFATAREALVAYLRSIGMPDVEARHIAVVGLYDGTPSTGLEGVFSDSC